MKAEAVYAAAQDWANAAPNRRVIAIGAQSGPEDHIRAFEAGMDQLMAVAVDEPGVSLALALPFDAVERGEANSYRRALKKYTRSVVFENIQLWLLLVRAGLPVEPVAPHEVNAFLAGLNAHVAAFKRASITERNQ